MSSNAKRVPEINLEDFERRLRAAGSAHGSVEDPLEELTRLVNTIASERPQPPAERVVELSALRPSRAAPPPEDLDEPEFSHPPQLEEDDEDAHEAPLLRPSLAATEDETPGTFPAFEAQPERAEAGSGSTRGLWRLKVGGVAVVALAMAAGAAYLKLHGSQIGSSSAPPMIMAANGPSKVAPPDEKAVQSPSDTGALLNKDTTGNGQVKVVSNQEQPIDLGLKGDSPVAPTKDSPIIAPGTALPIVQPAPIASATPDPTPNPPAAAPPVAKSKGPKTVSVRPDGTVITADAAAAAASPAVVPPPAQTTAKIDPAPSVTSQASSPTLDLPAKPTKATTRVNVSKTDTTAPTDPVSAPLQVGSVNAVAPADKPQKLPTKLRPPEAVADAQPASAPAGGDWAVQLAAPRSEADAQSAIQKLQTKYAAALGDNDLAVRKAEVNGDAIYRVRAVGLSKAAAQGLCQKLKADGGDCFVARN
jgi:SPOR domain